MSRSFSLGLNKFGLIFGILVLIVLQVWWCERAQLLHADLLYLESIYADVFERGRDPRLFFYTEAFFLFPDAIVYFLIRPWMSSAVWALVAYAAIFNTIYFAALYAIYKRIRGTAGSSAEFLIGGLVLIALGCLTPLYTGTAYWPNHHGTIQLVFLFYWSQMLFIREAPLRGLSFWCLFDFVFASLLSFSDMVMAPAILGPTVAVFVWWQYTGPRLKNGGRWTALHFALVNSAAIMVGFFAQRGLIYSGIFAGIPVAVDPEDYPRIYLSLSALPKSIPIILWRERLLLSFAFVSILLVYIGRRRLSPVSRSWLREFVYLSVLSVSLTALTLVATGRWPAPTGFERYFQQLVYLPLLWVFLWGVPGLGLNARAAAWLFPFGAIIVAVAINQMDLNGELLKIPALTACLDSHASELPTPWGLAGFYPAKLVTFTSQQKLVVNQVKKNFSAYAWMLSRAWYQEDIYGRHLQGTTYLIARDPSEVERAQAKWGSPASSFACHVDRKTAASALAVDDMRVLIYPQGINPAQWDNTPND